MKHHRAVFFLLIGFSKNMNKTLKAKQAKKKKRLNERGRVA